MVEPESHRREFRRHIFGVTLVLLVAFLWVAAGELTQRIYGDHGDFDKPFFLTYFCTSLFSIYLIGFAVIPSWRRAWTAEKSDAVEYEAVASTEEVSFSVTETAWLSVRFWPIWFSANLTYNWSLRKTSVASSTTISTLAGFFTLIFGALSGTERFTVVKLMSVTCT